MITKADIKGLALLDDMSDRLREASWLATGNIVEIGGGEGVNTIRFLSTARDKKTTVIVVDPFERIEGADESYFKPYTLDKFLNNISQQPLEIFKQMVLINLPSQHEDVKTELLAFRPIGFMFIDGLQDKKSVFEDLLLAEALGAEVICVDDYDRLTDTSQVPIAVFNFKVVTKYTFIDIGKREAYFIR
jgi:hypothetical protein